MTFEDADKRLKSLYTHGGPEAVHCPVCGRTFHPERTVDDKIVPADPPIGSYQYIKYRNGRELFVCNGCVKRFMRGDYRNDK